MLIDGNLTMVHKGTVLGASGGGSVTDITTNGAAASADNPSINLTLDLEGTTDTNSPTPVRQLGRGRPLYVIVSIHAQASANANQPWTFSVFTADAKTDGTGGSADTLTTAALVGSTRVPGNVAAGKHARIVIPDDTQRYLQVQAQRSSGTNANDSIQFSAFVSTELPTTTHIVDAPYVGYDVQNLSGGFGAQES